MSIDAPTASIIASVISAIATITAAIITLRAKAAERRDLAPQAASDTLSSSQAASAGRPTPEKVAEPDKESSAPPAASVIIKRGARERSLAYRMARNAAKAIYYLFLGINALTVIGAASLLFDHKYGVALVVFMLGLTLAGLAFLLDAAFDGQLGYP